MRCRRSSAAVSSKVRSGCSVITATTRSACCSSGETLPPRGFGAALLLSLQRCIHLTTELTLTPKCSAASCRDAPASTISIARSRKSQEYDFGIVTPRVRESMLKQSPIHDRLGIPRFKSAGSRFSCVKEGFATTEVFRILSGDKIPNPQQTKSCWGSSCRRGLRTEGIDLKLDVLPLAHEADVAVRYHGFDLKP